MESVSFSRSYLETLATDDLVRLGDELGLDIPLELNRRLIIGELLEMQEELRLAAEDSSDSEGLFEEEGEDAPLKSYNETRVSILLRNPGWLFVFWDLSSADLSECAQKPGFESFSLRVSFFEDAALSSLRDSCSTAVSADDRKRYIHILEQNCFCRADLLAINRLEGDIVLAQSNAVAIPPAAGIDVPKGGTEDAPPILSLSGIEELRREYRRNHRQAFL